MDTMANSAGSANREMETAAEAISYHLNDLKETWVGISQSLFKQDTVNGFIDALTSISEIIEKIVSKLGLLSTTLTAGGLFVGIKSIV